MKKKVLVIALALSLVAVTALGVTLAYFFDDETATNTFTVGNVSIRIDEPDWAYIGSEDAPEVYPGEKLNKDPSVANTGANPCVVRVKVAMPAGFENLISFEGMDTTDWVKVGDYYYFLKPVAVGASTTELFQGVRFSKDLTNGDPAIGRNIQVIAQAVQAQGILSGSWDSTMANGIDSSELPTVITVFNTAFNTPGA